MTQYIQLAAQARTVHTTSLKNTIAYSFVDPNETEFVRGFFLVAEGSDGSATRPDLTCQVTEATFVNAFGRLSNDISDNVEIEQLINQAFQQAAIRTDTAILALKQNVPLRWMESSIITCVLVCGDRALIVNVGPCRTYHFRNYRLKQITEDFTESSSGVRPLGNPSRATDKEITPAQINMFVQPLEPGDQLLLCSVDVWTTLGDEGLAKELSQTDKVELAFQQFIKSMENKTVGRDVSFVVVRVQ